MKDHASHWLGAHLDGELRGLRRRWVGSHLEECSACQRELNSLKTLRALLQESPAMEPAIASDRFAAQVALKLPRRQERPPAQRALEMSWRMVPVGLLFVLAFVQTVFIMAGVLRAALWLGVGGDVAAVVLPASAGGVSFPDVFALSQASLANVLQVAVGLVRIGTSLAWLPVLNVLLLAVIGMLYWSWLASWWVRRRHQQLTASNGLG